MFLEEYRASRWCDDADVFVDFGLERCAILRVEVRNYDWYVMGSSIEKSLFMGFELLNLSEVRLFRVIKKSFESVFLSFLFFAT